MAFPTGSNIQKLQDRAIDGVQHDAAVDCWFTATGETIPRLVKVKGAEEEIITIKDIQTFKVEQKFYGGTHCRKHWCRAEMNGIVKEFLLLFYVDECKWRIVI